MITKDEMVEAIRKLPDDATIRDAIERLELIALLDDRLAAVGRGEFVSQDEVERRVSTWHE